MRKNPAQSLVYDQKAEIEEYFLKSVKQEEFPDFTGQRKVILAHFGLTFLVMIFGVTPQSEIGLSFPKLDCWFGELTALFLLFYIIIGLVGRLGEEKLVSIFL